VFLSAVFQRKPDVGQLFALEHTGAYRGTVLLPHYPHDFIETRILNRQYISIRSEYFHGNGVPLLDRSARGEAATKIAHTLNEGSLLDVTPLAVYFGDLNRNMYQDSSFRPTLDQMRI
jgi:hypothetical protein